MPLSIRSTQNVSDTLKGKSSYANEPYIVSGLVKKMLKKNQISGEKLSNNYILSMLESIEQFSKVRKMLEKEAQTKPISFWQFEIFFMASQLEGFFA